MLQDLIVSGGSATLSSSSSHLPPSRSIRIGPALSKAVYQSIYLHHGITNTNHHAANDSGNNAALTSLSPMHGMDT